MKYVYNFNNWAKDQLSIVPNTSSIGLCRSLLALGTMLTLLFNSPNLLFANVMGEKMSIKEDIPRISLFYLLSENNVELARYIALFILLVVMVGIWPRYTAIPHWWVSYSVFNSVQVLDGGDQITNVITLLLVPILLTDGRRWHWEGVPIKSVNKKILFYFFTTLIRFQFCILYFQAATAKFLVPEWKNGTAVYYWLNNRAFGNKEILFVSYLVSTPLGVTLLTWGSLFIEMILSVGFFISRKYWPTLFWIGVVFHFLIFIIMGLTSFSIAMIGGLVIYYQPSFVGNINFHNKVQLS